MRDSMALTLLAAGIVFVLAVEWGMWRLFLRRVEGIHFPRASDTSQLRFFSLPRIRLCAIAHTLFLCTSLALLAAAAS